MTKKWRVWVKQVNQTYVDVTAGDVDEAVEKAERQWRRRWTPFRVGDVKRIEGADRKPAKGGAK